MVVQARGRGRTWQVDLRARAGGRCGSATRAGGPGPGRQPVEEVLVGAGARPGCGSRITAGRASTSRRAEGVHELVVLALGLLRREAPRRPRSSGAGAAPSGRAPARSSPAGAASPRSRRSSRWSVRLSSAQRSQARRPRARRPSRRRSRAAGRCPRASMRVAPRRGPATVSSASMIAKTSRISSAETAATVAPDVRGDRDEPLGLQELQRLAHRDGRNLEPAARRRR